VLEPATVDRPDPPPTEVRVKVAAAGVNPVDWKTRSRGGMLGSPTFTVGGAWPAWWKELGFGVTRSAAGDRFGMPSLPRETVPMPSS
jgi:NADPH:quinone reductase-like Zn-dependent oxidoreductase